MVRKVGVFFTVVLAWCSSQAVSESLDFEIFDPPAVVHFPVHEEIGRQLNVDHAVSMGRDFFTAKFNVLDGVGRPTATGDSKPTPRKRSPELFNRVSGPDASSCSGCHNQPEVGGSGEFAVNVFVGAHFSDPPTKSIDSGLTNERNTTGLFGSGAVELVAREMTEELRSQRQHALSSSESENTVNRVELYSKGISFGAISVHPNGYIDHSELEGVDYDLIIKPFGVKGVSISLREFTIAALNQHHGIQAIERFGWERTGSKDFDSDGVEIEFSIGQLTALTLFQASLAPPPEPDWSDPGIRIFQEIGCSSCHVPLLEVSSDNFTEPNPYNRPGTLTPEYSTSNPTLSLSLMASDSGFRVAAFSDFKRHRMCDDDINTLCNEQLRQDNVRQDEFLTAKLWDLSTSAPYCHRGDCPTISEAISKHGGEARQSLERYRKLDSTDKRNLIMFLSRLGKSE